MWLTQEKNDSQKVLNTDDRFQRLLKLASVNMASHNNESRPVVAIDNPRKNFGSPKKMSEL